MLRHGYDLQRLTDPFGGRSPSRASTWVNAATFTIAALAVVWFFLGSASLSAAIGRGTLSPVALGLLGIFTMANLGLLILASIAARSTRRLLRAFVIVVLGLNAVTSVTDQVGLADIAYLVLTIAASALVAYTWRRTALSLPQNP